MQGLYHTQHGLFPSQAQKSIIGCFDLLTSAVSLVAAWMLGLDLQGTAPEVFNSKYAVEATLMQHIGFALCRIYR
jgi:hypothetical protein